MQRIYIAHPYNGDTANKDKVEEIIKVLVKTNPNVLYISPIHAVGFLYNDIDYMQGMEYCFELLSIADELILCENWESSRGCRLEKEYAEKYNIPIRYLGR
jgi:hypothetical protein